MAHAKSRQIVTNDAKKWNSAIEKASSLLIKAENRVARLKGAIQTFTELRDCGHMFSGPESVEQIVAMTQSTDHKSEAATQC